MLRQSEIGEIIDYSKIEIVYKGMVGIDETLS
jgi:hypothetical protein